jgi:flagellar protein FliS
MFSTPNARQRFTDGTLLTASPPKIVILAYERLDRDLGGAIDAIQQRQLERANHLLCHAQDLVFELRCMLDLEAWEHARSLSSIYGYVTEVLLQANVKKNVEAVAEARRLLAEFGAAFKQAAATVPAVPAVPAADAPKVPDAAVVTATPRLLSVLA